MTEEARDWKDHVIGKDTAKVWPAAQQLYGADAKHVYVETERRNGKYLPIRLLVELSTNATERSACAKTAKSIANDRNVQGVRGILQDKGQRYLIIELG